MTNRIFEAVTGLVSFDRKGRWGRSYSFLSQSNYIRTVNHRFQGDDANQFLAVLDKIIDLSLCVLVATVL